MPSTTSGVADAEPDCTAAACCRPPMKASTAAANEASHDATGSAMEAVYALPMRSVIVSSLTPRLASCARVRASGRNSDAGNTAVPR